MVPILFPVKSWSVTCENEFLLLRPLCGCCVEGRPSHGFCNYGVKCRQPGTKGRGPKAGPGEVAWWVAAVAIWSSVSFNQRHPAAAFSIFRSLLQRPVAETLFHSLAWYLGPMGNRQPSWERSIRLLPQTFEQQKNLSVAVVCSSRASWGQSQSANRFIYSELKGLSAFECNISVLQSPSYSFSLLQGRVLHWFQRQQSNQQCVSVLQLRTGFPLHAATEQRYQFCVTSLPGHL